MRTPVRSEFATMETTSSVFQDVLICDKPEGSRLVRAFPIVVELAR
jgi:hypothetical protein